MVINMKELSNYQMDSIKNPSVPTIVIYVYDEQLCQIPYKMIHTTQYYNQRDLVDAFSTGRRMAFTEKPMVAFFHESLICNEEELSQFNVIDLR